MKYHISSEAVADLEKIWLYTLENWSIDQADRYLNLILNEIEYLSENPLTGSDFSYVRKVYMKSRIKSHFIFYKINSSKGVIEIIRILHQRMEIESRL